MSGNKRRLYLVILVIAFGLFVALCEYGNTEPVPSGMVLPHSGFAVMNYYASADVAVKKHGTIPEDEWEHLAEDLAKISAELTNPLVGKKVRIVLHQYLSQDVNEFREVRVRGIDSIFIVVEKHTDTYYVPINSIHFIKVIGD